MTQAENLKVLVVEDDEDLNKAYRMIIESAGYEVTSAHDGKQALTLIENGENPDIIFLDLRMPAMDGIDFLKHYHADEHDRTVVVFRN